MSMRDCGCDLETTLYGKPKPYYCERHRGIGKPSEAEFAGQGIDEEADVNDFKMVRPYKRPADPEGFNKMFAVAPTEPAPLSPERRYEYHPVTSTGVVTSIPFGSCTDGLGNAFEYLTGTVVISGGNCGGGKTIGIGGAPTRATTLPTGGAERKQFPVASGVLDYFPDALVAVANVSWVGNEQHNPGQPLHWARGKSGDESDTMIRHFLQRGSLDTDGIRHTAKMAWRALAILQKELEQEKS